ncbi:MAG: hypothetical protein J5858_16820 [Lentisphaeria bacterium]|nr:hypothetical protein [Lentisphaeria bacterium]
MKFTVILASLLAAAGLSADIKLEKFKTGSTDCIRVENEFYSVTVVPAYGGRIFQWKNKVSGIQFCDEAIPERPGMKVGSDAILDDRGNFPNLPYSAFDFQPDPETVDLYLRGTDPDRQLTIERKLTFRAGSPVIGVRYKYSNASHIPVAGFDLGQRNFFRVNGGKVTTDEMYFLPTTHTVRRMRGYDLKSDGPRPELMTKLKTALGAEWHAFLSRPKKTGIAVHHNDNWYVGWYMWKGCVDYPTYEWMYGNLDAGYSRETSYDLIQVDGFDAISYASKELLADMRMTPENGTLNVSLKVKALEKLPAKLMLKTSIRKFTSDKKTELKPIPFEGENFRQTLPLKGDGLYMIEQTVTSGRNVIARWYDSLTIGKGVTFEAVFHPTYARNTDPQMIPGWSALPENKVEMSPEAVKRDFVVAFPQRNSRYAECKGLNFRMACNEYESVELTLHPLSPSDTFTFSAEPPKGIGLRIVPETVLRRGRGAGGVPEFARILIPRDRVTAEKLATVWLIFDTTAAEPGKYKFPVTFKNKAGKAAEINVELTVSPVKLPNRKLVMLESEVNFPREVLLSPDLLRGWLQNMSQHGVDFLQLGGASSFKAYTPSRGVSAKGVAALDRLVDSSLENGLTRVKSARYSKEYPKEGEYENWKRLGIILRAKGYQNKDIFVKILDEQPTDQYPAMAAMGKWLKELGFRPFSTFSTLFTDPKNMKVLSPYFDMYQGGSIGPMSIAARRKDGLFKPGDLVGDYTGSGASFRTYENMINWGMRAAFLGHDFFHNHEYMRNGNSRLTSNIIMIGEDNLPLDSAAHEGLRDGMDFANLAALCRSWFEVLKDKKEYSSVLASARKKYDLVFGKILRAKPNSFRDFADYTMQGATEEDYRQAKPLLLDILESLRKATAGKDFARVTWNQYVLCEPGMIFQAEGPEADYFAAAFRKAFRLADGERKAGLKIVFKQAPADGLSYRIEPSKDQITVIAPTAEGLRKAADNWINTMDSTGVWF